MTSERVPSHHPHRIALLLALLECLYLIQMGRGGLHVLADRLQEAGAEDDPRSIYEAVRVE